jgi:hypothetical protein
VRIDAPALRLELAPVPGAAADPGAARVRVRIESGGFRGDVEVALAPDDLRQFEREIGLMASAADRPARAALSCAEPGLDLQLDAQAPGPVAGHFALESAREGGGWTTLSGPFELDRRELPALQASLLALLDALAR